LLIWLRLLLLGRFRRRRRWLLLLLSWPLTSSLLLAVREEEEVVDRSCGWFLPSCSLAFSPRGGRRRITL